MFLSCKNQFIAILFSSLVAAQAYGFSVTSFSFEKDISVINEQELKKSIDQFFAPHATSTIEYDSQKALSTAAQFREKIQSLLEQAHTMSNGYWKVQLTKQSKFHQYRVFEFAMPSLYVRGHHESDILYFKVFVPTINQRCHYRYPSAIMLHTLLNEFDQVEEFASYLVKFGTNRIVVMPYLPQFGPRRSNSTPFLTNNLAEIRANFMQSLLDTYMIEQWMKSHASEKILKQTIDHKRISMVGLSLGAVIGGLYAGVMPPVSGGYSLFAGGGDMAGIINNFILTDPEDELIVPYLKEGFDVHMYRQELAPVDPIVWASQVKDTKLQFYNTRDDEIMDYQLSILRMQNEFARGNRVDRRYYNGGHRLEVTSFFQKIKMMFKFFGPTAAFISKGSYQPTCGFLPQPN